MTTATTCPQCKAANTDDMSFCIFCGCSIKSGKLKGRKLTKAGRFCPSCGKTDELNDRYCVFCGQAILANYKDITGKPTATVSAAAQRQMIPQGEHRPASTKSPSGVLVLIASVIGLAAGAGAYFVVGKSPQGPIMPDRGLVILKTAPFTAVTVSQTLQDNFRNWVGETAADGNLAMPYLDPGTYNVALDKDNRQGAPLGVTVKQGTVAAVETQDGTSLVPGTIGR